MFLALEKKRTMADWKTGKPKWMNFNQSGWNRIILRDDSTLTTTTLCLLMCWTLKILLKYLFQACGNLLSSDHPVLNVQLFSRASEYEGKLILILGNKFPETVLYPAANLVERFLKMTQWKVSTISEVCQLNFTQTRNRITRIIDQISCNTHDLFEFGHTFFDDIKSSKIDFLKQFWTWAMVGFPIFGGKQ